MSFVQLYGIFISQVERIADEGVSDGYLCELGYILGEVGKVLQVEVMACIESQSQFCGPYGGCPVWDDGLFPIYMESVGIGLCVELYTVGASCGGAFYHGYHGVYEEGDADTGRLEFPHYFYEVIFMTDGVPAVVGGDLSQCIGYQGHLIGPDVQHQVYEFLFLRIAFDIELSRDNLFYIVYVLITDVSFIGARVYGDAIGAEQLCINGGFYNIGVIAAPAITEGGEFIYIYGELCHIAKVKEKEKGTEVPLCPVGRLGCSYLYCFTSMVL